MRLLPKRLRAARMSCGFRDVRAFAQVLDMPAERYERFEEGLERPDLEDLALISRITGKSLDFLIAGASTLPFLLGCKFWATGAAGVFQFAVI